MQTKTIIDNGNWPTLEDLKNKIYQLCNITFDPCPMNHTFDGLKISWAGNIYCNPPYYNCKLWVDKGLQELEKGNAKSIIYLVKLDPTTAWYQKLIDSQYFLWKKEIPKRLKFGGGRYSAPFPNVLIFLQSVLIWRKKTHD